MEFVLFLRSYGDFVVGLYALKHKPYQPYTILASTHLEPLYNALVQAVNWPLPPVTFIELGINKGLLAAFTNKFLLTTQSYKELSILKKKLQALRKEYPAATFWVEQYRRKNILELFTGIPFKAIHTNSSTNIYDSYMHFFADSSYYSSIELFTTPSSFIIFPDSRLAKKQLPQKFIDGIVTKANEENLKVKVAYFNKAYKNFDELIALIKHTEIIITADSLPAHIAQYIHIPHVICYTKKVNKEWITPFAEQLQSFNIVGTIMENNTPPSDDDSTSHLFN